MIQNDFNINDITNQQLLSFLQARSQLIYEDYLDRSYGADSYKYKVYLATLTKKDLQEYNYFGLYPYGFKQGDSKILNFLPEQYNKVYIKYTIQYVNSNPNPMFFTIDQYLFDPTYTFYSIVEPNKICMIEKFNYQFDETPEILSYGDYKLNYSFLQQNCKQLSQIDEKSDNFKGFVGNFKIGETDYYYYITKEEGNLSSHGNSYNGLANFFPLVSSKIFYESLIDSDIQTFSKKQLHRNPPPDAHSLHEILDTLVSDYGQFNMNHEVPKPISVLDEQGI